MNLNGNWKMRFQIFLPSGSFIQQSHHFSDCPLSSRLSPQHDLHHDRNMVLSTKIFTVKNYPSTSWLGKSCILIYTIVINICRVTFPTTAAGGYFSFKHRFSPQPCDWHTSPCLPLFLTQKCNLLRERREVGKGRSAITCLAQDVNGIITFLRWIKFSPNKESWTVCYQASRSRPGSRFYPRNHWKKTAVVPQTHLN